MRLRDIQQILKRHLKGLEPRFHDAQYQPHVPGPTSPGTTHPNFDELRTALEAVLAIPSLGDLAKQILAIPVMARFPKETVVPATQMGPASQLLLVLHTRAAELLAALDGVLPEEDSLAFTVQLPSDATLRDTLLLLARVERMLRLVGGTEPVEIRVRTFDPGSLNIELLGKIVGQRPAAFYCNFMLVLTAATLARDFAIETATDFAKYRGYEAISQSITGTVDMKGLIRERARAVLLEKNPSLRQGDELERLVLASAQMTALLEQEVRILQSFNPPAEALKPEAPKLQAPEALKQLLGDVGGGTRLLESALDDEADEAGGP